MIKAELAPPFYPKDDRPLVAFTLPYAQMVERFGPAHRVMDELDNEPGPCEYWSFVFPCGMTILSLTIFMHQLEREDRSVRRHLRLIIF